MTLPIPSLREVKPICHETPNGFEVEGHGPMPILWFKNFNDWNDKRYSNWLAYKSTFKKKRLARKPRGK